jgi:3-hydroxyacyl-CoA dehydrogenase
MFNEIQTIAVIGAGKQGREIASAALRAGYQTILEDVSENRRQQAVDWITKVHADAGSAPVLASTVEEAVREADLIIEAVAEEMEMKIEMFTIFDKFAKPGAVFASSSPSLSIAELAAVTFCPGRCIGMRFTSSPRAANALELVCAPQTFEETVARCREVGRQMGKQVRVISDMEPRRQDAFCGSGQASATDIASQEPRPEILQD